MIHKFCLCMRFFKCAGNEQPRGGRHSEEHQGPSSSSEAFDDRGFDEKEQRRHIVHCDTLWLMPLLKNEDVKRRTQQRNGAIDVSKKVCCFGGWPCLNNLVCLEKKFAAVLLGTAGKNHSR